MVAKIDNERLIQLYDAKPRPTLSVMAKEFGCSPSAVSQKMTKLGLRISTEAVRQQRVKYVRSKLNFKDRLEQNIEMCLETVEELQQAAPDDVLAKVNSGILEQILKFLAEIRKSLTSITQIQKDLTQSQAITVQVLLDLNERILHENDEIQETWFKLLKRIGIDKGFIEAGGGSPAITETSSCR